MTDENIASRIERLEWSDPLIGTIDLPRAPLVMRAGFGSGLAVRRGDPPGMVWAIGDRGPNLKAKAAVDSYGADHLSTLAGVGGARIMPRPGIGPELAQLRVVGDRVELVRTLRLVGEDGRPVSGLPDAGSDQIALEPVFDLAGQRLAADPLGLDSEGVVALADGGFWIGDEFGPALVRLDAEGRVISRLLPADGALPVIATRRQLNRGFEALALSADERWLFLAFQSPLAHPDVAAHEQARHVRLWQLDAATGKVVAQFAYPLDPSASFVRDVAAGDFGLSDIKVSELLWLRDDTLLVLERGSHTTKLYRVVLSAACVLPPEHLDIATRPTLEQLSADGAAFTLPVLEKTLLWSSDDAPQVSPDLEGMAMLAPDTLLLVNDNDFGVEGATTHFWRLTFDQRI